MDKLEAMRLFVAVARAGGFSAASRELGQPVATVSRKVAELEGALGVRLFQRSTRQVVLTEHAATYLDACQRILDELRDADETVVGEYREPKGELSVTAPVGFGRQHLQPVVTEFLRAHPLVDMRLLLADRVVDLLDEHVDAAVRIGALPDSGLVARRVGSVGMVICGSPDYLAAHGTPAHPSGLAGHRCIAWSGLGPSKSWQLDDAGVAATFPIRVRLTTTTPESAVEAAVAGLGLVRAPTYQVEAAVRAGTLLTVLRTFDPEPWPVHLMYPHQRGLPLKLRTFLDFATPRLSDRLGAVAQAF